MKEAYYFGRLVREIDCFAFPRTGSHFFRYAISGLFDLVAPANPHLHNQEAIGRQRELRQEVLYALDLREDGVPFQPIRINALRNGMHGQPIASENPALLLIRDPIATAYSLFRVNQDRWGIAIQNPRAWLLDILRQYIDFYRAGFKLLRESPTTTHLVRYEDLLADSGALRRLVAFIGVRPKLQPDFIHWLLRFENIAAPGERTFYRSGNNTAWRQDSLWMEMMPLVREFDFSEFGYALPDFSATEVRR